MRRGGAAAGSVKWAEFMPKLDVCKRFQSNVTNIPGVLWDLYTKYTKLIGKTVGLVAV